MKFHLPTIIAAKVIIVMMITKNMKT